MATHSNLFPWRIPWTEEPGGLQSMVGCKELDTTELLTPTHTALGSSQTLGGASAQFPPDLIAPLPLASCALSVASPLHVVLSTSEDSSKVPSGGRE